MKLEVRGQNVINADVSLAFYPDRWCVSQQKAVEDVCAAEVANVSDPDNPILRRTRLSKSIAINLSEAILFDNIG
jgi:hypothetical protein